MKNILLTFKTANVSDYKEVWDEWSQGGKLSNILDYFNRLIAEGHLFCGLPTTQLAKLLYQDPKKQRYAYKNAEKYNGCWGFRSYTKDLEFLPGGGRNKELDTKIQIKVPKVVQEQIQRANEEKQRREGGELKKAPKYLSSQGVAAPVFLMPIANRNHHLIGANPNAYEQGGILNWTRIRDHLIDTPIIIIEGVKKGAVLSAHGYAVIALPGVWQGLKKSEEYGKEIVDIINQFAVEGRQFYICFDNDPIEKKGTREGVGLALHQLARKLQSATKVSPRIITWDYPEKGADDLVAEHGIEVFNDAYRQAKPLGQWESIHFYNIYEKPDLEFNDRYFPDFDIPEVVTKALIVGTQGTGKSRQIKRQIKKYLAAGYGVVAITMSDSLKKQSCDKWGLNTIEAIWNGTPKEGRSLFGFMGCADSMFKLYSKIKELTENGTVKGFILILDEVEALFDHILTSTTEVSKNLSENIRMFRELIHDSHMILCADADASGTTWDLINHLKGGKSFYIKNHYQYRNRIIIHWDDYYSMINLGLLKVANSPTKKGILITTQGGKEGSKVGAYTLEDVLAGNLSSEDMEDDHNAAMDACKILECSGRKIWVVTARTISDKKHPCYQVIKDEETFNAFVQRVGANGDIVIISNVIPTGFSIDEPHNFGYQFSFGQGVNNPVGFVQHINRLRGDNVERHISVTSRSIPKYGNGSTTYKGILAGIKYNAKANNEALKNWYNIEVADLQEDHLFKIYSAKIFARNNLAAYGYQDWVVGRLKYVCGYNIIESNEWLEAKTTTWQNPDPDSEIIYSEDEVVELTKGIKPLKLNIRDHAEKAMVKRYQKVADQKPCTPDELKYLQEKKRKGDINLQGELERLTPDESDRLLRAEFVETTGGNLPPTAENLRKYDQDGWLGKLRLLYYATKGRDQVGELSALAIERNVKNKQHVARKTYSKVIAGKLKFLSDNGCDDLLNLLYKILLIQSKDQNFYKYIIDRNFDQNFDQFFAPMTPNDPPEGSNTFESSNKQELEGGAVQLEILTSSEGWEKICKSIRSKSYACKQLLGFKPAEKYIISLIRQLLGIFGLEVIKKGSSRRNEKYYLVVPQDAHLYLNYLQERSHPKPLNSPENSKLLDLIIEKSETKDAVTSYIKDAVNGLPAIDDSTSLSDLVGWGELSKPILPDLKAALDAGYDEYCKARRGWLETVGSENSDPRVNTIILDAIDTFEAENKEKIAKLEPIFYSSKQAINAKEWWKKLLSDCHPAALLINKIRHGVNVTQIFLNECKDLYNQYSQTFDQWYTDRIIAPDEYKAIRGSC